jgi:hypothetical protein
MSTSPNVFANAQPISLDFDVSFDESNTEPTSTSPKQAKPASTSIKPDTSSLNTPIPAKPQEKVEEPTEPTEPPTSLKDDGTSPTALAKELSLDNIDFSLTDEGAQTEDPTEEPLSQESQAIVNIANKLAETVFGGELLPFEGFDTESEPDEDSVLALIRHNVEIQKEEAVQEFFNDMPETVQRLIQFSLNAANPADAEEDIISYARVLIEKSNISNLNVEDEYDQERIVRSWYSNEDWGAEEIEEKVSDLKNANLLEKEAKRIKPKLDQAAEAIAQRKEEEAQQIRQLEMRYKKDYIVRLQELFSKDRIANVAFNPTEKQNLLTSLISDDVEVAMPGGKKVKMPYLEALITYHRFSPKADLENLALATMILTDRAAFDAKYSKMLETKVTSEFVKDHKYDANKKAGLLKVKDNGQKTTPTQSNKGWGNVFKK